MAFSLIALEIDCCYAECH